MKRSRTITLVILMLAGVCAGALAADPVYNEEMSFSFDLAVSDNSSADAIAPEGSVAPGDTIKIELLASRADLEEGFVMYALLTETVYDSACFQLVPDSATMTSIDSHSGHTALWDMSGGTNKRVDMGYMTRNQYGGAMPSSIVVGSLLLEVRELPEGTESVTTTIALQNCYLGTYDGMARYMTDSQGSAEITIVRPDPVTPPVTPPGGGEVPTRPPGPSDQRPSETIILDPDDPPLAGMRFEDVPLDHWAYDYIEYLAIREIVTGYPDNTFRPSNNITRADFVTLLARMSGDALPESYRGSFTDIQAGAYYESAVAWSVNNGMVTGTTITTFSPDDFITREQMATLIFRYAVVRGYVFVIWNDPSDFTDSGLISEYAREAVQLMQRADIINGYEDGSFRPHGKATRDEAATLMARLYFLMSVGAGD